MHNLFVSENAHLAAAYYGFYTAADFDPVRTGALIRAAHDAAPSDLLDDLLFIAARIARGWPYNESRIEVLRDGTVVVILADGSPVPRSVAFSANSVVAGGVRDWIRVAPDLLPEELHSAFVLGALSVICYLPTP